MNIKGCKLMFLSNVIYHSLNYNNVEIRISTTN